NVSARWPCGRPIPPGSAQDKPHVRRAGAHKGRPYGTDPASRQHVRGAARTRPAPTATAPPPESRLRREWLPDPAPRHDADLLVGEVTPGVLGPGVTVNL